MQDPRIELVRDFYSLVRQSNDDLPGVFACIDFFNRLLRVKNPTPPLAEAMTVLKIERPVLFVLLKNRISQGNPIHMLLQFSMSYDDAKLKLEQIAKSA